MVVGRMRGREDLCGQVWSQCLTPSQLPWCFHWCPDGCRDGPASGRGFIPSIFSSTLPPKPWPAWFNCKLYTLTLGIGGCRYLQSLYTRSRVSCRSCCFFFRWEMVKSQKRNWAESLVRTVFTWQMLLELKPEGSQISSRLCRVTPRVLPVSAALCVVLTTVMEESNRWNFGVLVSSRSSEIH